MLIWTFETDFDIVHTRAWRVGAPNSVSPLLAGNISFRHNDLLQKQPNKMPVLYHLARREIKTELFVHFFVLLC